MKVEIVNPSKSKINKLALTQWVQKVFKELYRLRLDLNFHRSKHKLSHQKFLKGNSFFDSDIKWTSNCTHKVVDYSKTDGFFDSDIKLTLAFVDEQTIKSLNKQFRKKNCVTDILSFSPVEEDSLGELALCLSIIEQKKPDELSSQEWLFYLVLHGILHLLGFEHESGKASAQEMYNLQDSIFNKLK